MSTSKFSQIASGGALVPATDVLLAVRTGNTDVVVTPGTAAAMAASLSAGTALASIYGSVTAGHVATFYDTNGTVQDGGPSGTAAGLAASNPSYTYVSAVDGVTAVGHFALFSDTHGSIQDGGSTIDEAQISLSNNTTNNVTSAHHGFCPVSPSNTAMFLNGGATPAWVSLPVGSATQEGILQVDGVTITASGGVISAQGGASVPYVAGSGTASATGANAFAAGGSSVATQVSSVVIGYQSAEIDLTGGGSNVVIGAGANINAGVPASIQDSIVIGKSATSDASNTVIIGNTANAGGEYAIAIGYNAAAVANQIQLATSTYLIGTDNTGNFQLVTAADTAASSVATLTNFPTAAAGNPTAFMKINFNNAVYCLPLWPA